jgi:hypothetical protein
MLYCHVLTLTPPCRVKFFTISCLTKMGSTTLQINIALHIMIYAPYYAGKIEYSIAQSFFVTFSDCVIS